MNIYKCFHLILSEQKVKYQMAWNNFWNKQNIETMHWKLTHTHRKEIFQLVSSDPNL